MPTFKRFSQHNIRLNTIIRPKAVEASLSYPYIRIQFFVCVLIDACFQKKAIAIEDEGDKPIRNNNGSLWQDRNLFLKEAREIFQPRPSGLVFVVTGELSSPPHRYSAIVAAVPKKYAAPEQLSR